MRGPLVQASVEAWQASAEVFNAIGAQGYWDYKLGDSEWREHCRRLHLQETINRYLGL